MLFGEAIEERADRLIQHGWLLAMADLVRDGQEYQAKSMLDRFGISRDKLLGAQLPPWDLRLLIELYPPNPSRGFVSGNHDPRVAVVHPDRLPANVARFLRENGEDLPQNGGGGR